MWLDRKPFIYIWRPIYGMVFGGRLLLAESIQRLGRVEDRLATLETVRRMALEAGEQAARIESRLVALQGELASRIEGRLVALQAAAERLAAEDCQRAASLRGQVDALAAQIKELDPNNAAQWTAIEQLLIAVLGSSVRESLAAARSGASDAVDPPS